MALVEYRIGPRPRHAAQASIITLSGEHDLSTIDQDKAALAAAIASGDDVVLDASGVTFMSAATVGLIVRARHVLAHQSRSLTLQSPSRSAQRVLDLCGVA